MSNSREMRRLSAKWQQNTGWPKRLEFVELDGIRGWDGQRIPFNFPIVAVVGENGTGKSTILQCAAATYQPPKNSKSDGWFASEFLPKTIWENVQRAEIRYSVREGNRTVSGSIRKPGERWRGNPDRPERHVNYIDLRRLQPIVARMGYSKLAKDATKELSAKAFEAARLTRFSQIMGRQFSGTRMALTDADKNRTVPVFIDKGTNEAQAYSGYHAGAGQMTIAEFLKLDPPEHGLVLIDEIETSLHPRAQRRLIRDLAELCRERDLQIIVSTHSPYVLAELPLEARIYLMQGQSGRHVMTGVSPEFAMTKMDEYPHPECEIYVEDDRARTMLREIIVARQKGLIERCTMIPFGQASVGRMLGLMVQQNRFPRPSCVFLDGDQSDAPGCNLLPGQDAPERVVFGDLQRFAWGKLRERVGRPYAEVADTCTRVMSLADHHDWVNAAATSLTIPGETLWQAMCAEWATNYLDAETAKPVIQVVADLLLASPTTVSSPTVRLPLFERSRDAFEDQEPLP